MCLKIIMGMMKMLFNEEMDKYAHRLNANRVFFTQDKSKMDIIRPALHSILQNQLTDKQRLCVEMYYFENQNTTKIAQRLGTTRANVSKHIRRALNNMEHSMRYLFMIKTGEDE